MKNFIYWVVSTFVVIDMFCIILVHIVFNFGLQHDCYLRCTTDCGNFVVKIVSQLRTIVKFDHMKYIHDK